MTSRRNDLIVPSSEGEITDSWLLAALADPLPGVGCEAIRIERIGAEYGMASEILRCVFADDSIDEHNSVIIKLWPTNTSAGSAEASFYETFGNRIGGRIPACFHAAVDSDRQRAVLVLEDIRDAVQGDCLQSLTAALAGDVARSLAGIHANWVGRPALQEAAWLRSFFPWEPAAAWFLSRRKAFLERYREKLDDFSRSY